MVAPTRTPHARGVKCDLCKKILATATWLDQTKLAKCVEDAQLVIQLFEQHGETKCPCIPKNIENLLVGSTHFEVHRLVAKQLDMQIHRKQTEYSSQTRQRLTQEKSKNQYNDISDCNEMLKTSRFKIYGGYNDKRYHNMTDQQLKHLIEAIKFWNLAMQDQANPFNSKLALRLGLTHHVIYACYLFKYNRMLDHQLISANLLRNLFRSIEGVTAHAMLHANYLYIKTLLDCNQISLAKESLKQASKIADYEDKSYYESILLTCASCELSLLDNESNYDTELETLAKLAIIKPDDKLQHYYARTLAMSIIIKYIHCYPARSDLCFEFYHTFRYICAIIRRCYESSFELVLSEKELKHDPRTGYGSQKAEILDHSWIRFAACDFVLATFDLLSKFYMRAGQPESLELLYNGLNLIVYRNGCFYWQTRLAMIGANLDILCDKFDCAEEKLTAVSNINSQASDHHIMNYMRLELEVNSLALILYQQRIQETKEREVTTDLLQRLKTCHCSLMDRISKIELLDCKSNSFHKLNYNFDHHQEDVIVFGGILEHLCLIIIKINIWLASKTNDLEDAKELITKLGSQLGNMLRHSLDYNSNHIILETMLLFVGIEKSDHFLLDTVCSSNLFLSLSNNVQNIEPQFSMLTISGQSDLSPAPIKRKTGRSKSKMTKLPALSRTGKRKGNYDVASASEENLVPYYSSRYYNTINLIRNFSSVTNEEIVTSYLTNSEPNPDYILYRHAHELMLSYRLRDGYHNYDQLLYHFSESSTSNTMRYRWMMFEEQQATQSSERGNWIVGHLSFSNILIDSDKTQRSFLKSLPEEYKIVQLKYIIDTEAHKEHLLIASSDKQHESTIFAHVERQLISDDFFEDTNVEVESLSIPKKFWAKIEEAKKTLSRMNQRSRLEARKRIEDDIGVLLGNLEDEWLGPLRFLLCGKISDTKYRKFVQDMKVYLLDIMKNYSCSSLIALEAFIENAPLLGREGFRHLISCLFNCSTTCIEERECFNKWLKSMETFVSDSKPGLSKIDYLNTLTRGQIGIILDKNLEMVPFESLSIMKEIKQGIFRIPSVRLFHLISSRERHLVFSSDETAYILDPANNLPKTKERFENKLKSHSNWSGTISRPPNPDVLEEWLLTKHLYLFIGHGAGTMYYNKLCKGRGISAMPSIKPISIVMGCSSGRVMSEGPRLEPFGIGWIFVFRGSPCYVGLLWDVTDTDIDNFLDSLLENWLSMKWQTSNDRKELFHLPITNAVCKAKLVCKFKFLVGSTPVVYGLPMSCE